MTKEFKIEIDTIGGGAFVTDYGCNRICDQSKLSHEERRHIAAALRKAAEKFCPFIDTERTHNDDISMRGGNQ